MPEEAGEEEVEVPVGDSLRLALRGRTLAASDRRIVEACAQQAAVALDHEQVTDEAAAARPLAEVDRVKTALLTSSGCEP